MNELLKDILGILAVLVLVLLNGFFVAAEFALVSVRKTRIEELANQGSRRAKHVQRALTHLDTYIAATQLGITMASLALGFVGEPALIHLLEPAFHFLPASKAVITSHGIAFTLSFIIVTALHIVFGELAPKSIALQRPDTTSLAVTAPLDIFLRVFRPFIHSLNATGNFVVRLLGLNPVAEHAAVHSVDELAILVHSSREAGIIAEQQERMVAGVFDFGDTIVRKVMTSRLDISAIAIDTPTDELIRFVSETGHSRLPVYEGHLDNIIGVVHVKDVLQNVLNQKQKTPLRDLLRPPSFVPENKRASFLLAEMRRSKTQLALVRDEYGVLSGVVTIEDLLEEIVGDILDEYDVEETLLTQADAHTWLIEGTMLLEDLNERLDLKLPTEESDTLGGFVFSLLGHQPALKESVAYHGVLLEVAETDGRRVQKVRLTLQEPDTETDTSHEE
jgi:CBS domain containing-hemolysin-like protein